MSYVAKARNRASSSIRKMLTIQEEVDAAIERSGAIQARLASVHPPNDVNDAEFQVFSQWNEDGIINYLIHRIDIPSRTFVEIGVSNYRECNTRFLAVNDNWSGLAINGGEDHVDFISRRGLDWRFGVRAVSAFVTRENINTVIRDHGVSGDIGLLSIDVDGVDYWLFDAVEVISPRILILEYNSMFGSAVGVTVPYRADFSWHKAHSSMVYHGASLVALVDKANQKGYSFVGCESHGVNAFFVRNDVLAGVRVQSVIEGFRMSRFPVMHEGSGNLNLWCTNADKLAAIARLPVVMTTSGETVTVANAMRGQVVPRT